MSEIFYNFPTLILIIGLLIYVSLLVKAVFQKFHISPIAGYILLGVIFRYSEAAFRFLPVGTDEIVGFLGEIGIITILFHVGLESHLKKLQKQLGSASYFAISNVLIAGFLGFIVPYLLPLSL